MGKALLRARKLLAGISHPAYRRGLKLGVGASIEHREALQRFRFDTVVDVGANKGQFALFARTQFPQSRIVSFEPLDAPAAIWDKLFAGDRNARLVRAAIGKARGTLVMHVTSDQDSSSPLEIGENQRNAFGTVEVAQKEVPAGPLGDYLEPGELGEDNLLKIDTQGYELPVLEGAEDLLQHFKAIYCECSYVELYKGQALATEIVTHLQARNFALAGVYNQAEAEGRPVQADMLFLRG